VSGFALTPDQARAVTATGIDLSVMAGAGSGKTRVLVERVVHLVTEGGVALSSILAITFTEKAAREMKVRLAAAFAESPETRAEVEWAYVSTIHGFCARLLRENALEAEVDPSFEVLDEVASATLLTRVVREEAAADPDVVDAIGRLSLTDPEDAVLALLTALRARNVDPGDFRIPAPDPAALRARVEAVASSLAELPSLIAAAPAKSAAKARAVLSHGEDVSRLLDGEPDPEETVAVLRALSDSIGLQVSKPLKEVLGPLKGEIAPAAVRHAADFLVEPALRALRDLLGRTDRAYSRLKEETGALDFADLEIRALRLLREHEAVRDAVRSRFQQILVDEYQDVNPVQEAILEAIRTEGRHFAVGDVKQAIYGFRHAEPRLFQRYSKSVPPEGRVFLAANFRSAPPLVDFANRCFSTLFADQDLVDWTDMVAAGPEAEGDGSAVEVLLAPGASAAESRAAEASAIADRIRGLVREEGFRYGDVALLFRALTDVKTYERALEDRGVPYYVVKGRGFFQAREIVDLVCLLRCVQNPRDEVTLAAALRSPFAAISEDGLLALVSAARRRQGRLADLLATPFDVPDLPPGDARRWGRFARRLDGLRTLAARGSIREVVTTAIHGSEYGTAVWLLPSGPRRAANFAKAVSLAESMEGRFGFAEFIEVLSEFRAREVRETEAPTGGEQEDVVRLLTVHAAKGLEFPVVFVPDLSRKSNLPPPDLLSGELGVSARLRDEVRGGAVPTRAFAALAEERSARENEEALRIFYVAVTRAERRLVLSSRAGGKAPTGSWHEFLGRVVDLAGDGEEIAITTVEPAAEATERRSSLAARSRPALALAEPLGGATEEDEAAADSLFDLADRPRPVPDGTPYQATISELLTWSACSRCHWLRHHLGVGEPLFTPGGEEDAEEKDRAGLLELSPIDRGIAVHEILKVWDPRSGVAAIDAARERLPGLLPGATEELVRAAAALAASFYECDVGREVLDADPLRVRREVPFLVRWPTAKGLADLLFRGQLDLLYPRPDGALHIVDYKTGRSSPSRYHVQLVAYARAVRAFAPGEVAASLVHLGPGVPPTVSEVPLTEAVFAAVSEKADAFATYLRDGCPEPEGHTEDCLVSSPDEGDQLRSGW